MTIEEMQKIYNDISAFKDAMRNHACDSTFTNNSFYDEPQRRQLLTAAGVC